MKKLIEERLQCLLPTDSKLYIAARHILFAPAKRIRPLLILAGAQDYGLSLMQAVDPACALELIHTYSLIHDDLPAMDDDNTRRGLPTVHKLYDEATAILTGDFLLTFAFEVLAQAPLLSSDTKISLISLFAKASGAEGMVGGQLLDIDNYHAIERIHHMKTACLFRCAMQCVAVLANQPLKDLEAFGIHFGLLFQLIDDLLDQDHPDGEEAAINKAYDHYDSCTQILKTLPIAPNALSTQLESLYTKLLAYAPL